DGTPQCYVIFHTSGLTIMSDYHTARYMGLLENWLQYIIPKFSEKRPFGKMAFRIMSDISGAVYHLQENDSKTFSGLSRIANNIKLR
ncbi:4444_t:CDS:2, partial [Funneliformis mosseae]